MDQNRLSEILARMQSDYIPEHTAAADEFMQEGYPTSILFAEVEKTQQPNLVSMYFYISGKRSDEESLQAWNYLRKRIEFAPDQFVSRTYDPMELTPENRYLLFAARKYLTTSKNYLVFLSHLENVKREAENCIKSILSTLDVTQDTFVISGEDPGDYNTMMSAYVRYAIKREFPQFQRLGEENQNLTPEELHLASQITSLDIYNDCCRIQKVDTIPLLFYRQWLVNFFFSAVKDGPSCPSKVDDLTRYMGYNASNTPVTVSKYSWDEIKHCFQRVRDLIISFPLSEYFEKARKSGNIQFGRPYLPDVPCPYYEAIDKLMDMQRTHQMWSIRSLLCECEDVNLRLDMLNRVENIIFLQLNGDKQAYETAVVSTNMYFYFKQDIYDAGYSLDFCNNLLFSGCSKSTEFYEDLLLCHLDANAILDLNSKREARTYMALDVLFERSSIAAYNFVLSILSNNELAKKLEPPAKKYWEFHLKRLYKNLKRRYKSNSDPFIVGLKWEALCQRVCQTHFENTLTNHNGIQLSNNFIPDIIIGLPKRNTVGRITHVKKIIECKKSLYFTGPLDNLNNDTTDKYINHCDLLEYWVLEKPDNFCNPNYYKVSYVFAQDLLTASWLGDYFKSEICSLLQNAQSSSSRAPETIGELLFAIDQLLDSPPRLPSSSKAKARRKILLNGIRQYSLDGTFLTEFQSVQEAAAKTGLRIDVITNVISGRRNSAGGYLWRKCLLGSPTENIEPPNTALDLAGKVIFQIDQNGEVISTYDTIGQASKLSGINRRSISDALKGIQKTAGGFTWALAEIPNEP